MNYYYNDFRAWCTGCILIILLWIVFVSFGGFIFMLLWNWLMPLFWTNAPILNFFESCGVCVWLSWICSFLESNHQTR